MKKRIIILTLIITMCVGLVGCSSKKDERTLDDFITAFSNQDIEIDKESTPFFFMIAATDGVEFDTDDKVVIYVYDSEKDLEKAKKDFEIIKDWNTNGRFLLETDNQDAIDIFNSVE